MYDNFRNIMTRTPFRIALTNRNELLLTIIQPKINKSRLHLFQLTLDVLFFKRKTERQGQSVGKENPMNVGYHDHHGNLSTLKSRSGHGGS